MLDRQTLGRKIRASRTRKGLSHDKLAEELGTTRQVVIAWEKGKHRPAMKHAPRLSELTEIPLEQIRDPEASGSVDLDALLQRLQDVEEEQASQRELLGRVADRVEQLQSDLAAGE